MNKVLNGQTVTFEVTSKEKLRDLAGPLLATGFVIFIFVFGMLVSASWYYKVMFSTALIPILINIYGFKVFAPFSGRNKVRFSEEGIVYLNPSSSFDKWIWKKLGADDVEYLFIPWNELHRIDCYDRRKGQRKRNGRISPHPQIIFTYRDGNEFILSRSTFMEANRHNLKLKMIYEELKKEAAQRGIPFTTELESEDCWIGPILTME